jgi:cytochrome P450
VARRIAITPALAGFLTWPRARNNPYPAYAALRRIDPVHASSFGAWVLAKHADVSACLRNAALGVDERNIDTAWLLSRPLTRLLFGKAMNRPSSSSTQLMERLMLFKDPPDHTRLRSLVSKAFTPRAVAAVESRTQSILDELLEQVTPNGSMELMSEIAYPLPARVICEMLGVPTDDYPFIVAQAPVVARRLDPIISDEVVRSCDRAATELMSYIEGLIESRRRHPGPDLLSALMAAEEDGGRLSHDELVATVILLLIAGHETTANLIGNGLLALLRHPDQVSRFRQDGDLDRSAVEELLRYDGPVQVTQRTTVEALAVGGATIPPGRMVILCIGAANRDPEVFARPGALDLGRSPNPHVAFSGGGHFCLGAPLARMEARLTLRALVDRLPGLELADRPRWRPGFTIRGVTALQLRWPGSRYSPLPSNRISVSNRISDSNRISVSNRSRVATNGA